MYIIKKEVAEMSSRKSVQRIVVTLHNKDCCDSYYKLINLLVKKSIETSVSEISLSIENAVEVLKCNIKELFLNINDMRTVRVKVYHASDNELENTTNLLLFDDIQRNDNIITFSINKNMLPHVKYLYDATSLKK